MELLSNESLKELEHELRFKRRFSDRVYFEYHRANVDAFSKDSDVAQTYPIEYVVDEVLRYADSTERLVLLDALPNSGKTKWLPAVLARRGYKVLLLTPQKGDLVNIYEHLTNLQVPCWAYAGQGFRRSPPSQLRLFPSCTGAERITSSSAENEDAGTGACNSSDEISASAISSGWVSILSMGLGVRWIQDDIDDNWRFAGKFWEENDIILVDEAHFVATHYEYGHLLTRLLAFPNLLHQTMFLMSGSMPESLFSAQPCCQPLPVVKCHLRQHDLHVYHFCCESADTVSGLRFYLFLGISRFFFFSVVL